MELNLFIQKFSNLFEETPKVSIESNTKFRELEEWSSLLAMSVIAMVDEEFNKVLTGEDIRKSVTIEDLYNILKTKM